MSIEEKTREMLLPILGLDSIDEVKPNDSLVNDLGADSIDFVEMIYCIEQEFGVVLKANEIIVGGINSEELFDDDRLTEKGAQVIAEKLADEDGRYKAGMTKVELFSALTVKDLANIIVMKQSS